ncbi:MAG: hypothetical protein M3O30_11855 [Planctomycetota bacterium]|nr:hypothetical protein [Planctomycetota bacterium]
MGRVIAVAFIILGLAFCQGCASYEFDIVQPPSASRPIGKDEISKIHIDPLDFAFRTVEGRLVMWVRNDTKDPIEILGSRSAVVDPNGQSHPLLGQTIVPGSFIKLVLPPFRPRIDQPSPAIGIGIGISSGGPDGPGYVRPNGFGGGTARMDIDESANPYYWDWEGETEVRLTLVYQRGDTINQISFIFHRVKK